MAIHAGGRGPGHMSRSPLNPAGLGGGSPVEPPIIYDTRFGTATDANGYFSFPLHAGNKRTYVDNQRADDTGDGLTPTTAKKTLEAAKTVFFGSYSPGDQLMIAGGVLGGSYTDAGSFGDMSGKAGISLAYPTAVLSYDRADPTNADKIGRLTGSQMPTILTPAGASMFQKPGHGKTTHSGGTDHWFAVQGIEFDGQNTSGAAIQYIGRHDGLCFQNVRFKEIRLVVSCEASSYGRSQHLNVSKFTTWGMWNGPDGNFSCLYLSGVNGRWIQDGVLAHGGWKIGANRDDPTASGGTSVYGHNIYSHADETTGHRFDRLVSIDSSNNGVGVRGHGIITSIVGIDCPVALVMGSYSTTQAELPTGAIVTADDVLIIGTADINTANQLSQGIGTVSAIAGSYVKNVAMLDNPLGTTRGTPFSQSHYFGGSDLAFVTNISLDKVHSYNFGNVAELIYYGPTADPTKAVVTWTNSIMDSTTYYEGSTNTTGTVDSGITVWSAAPPAYQTRDQLFTTALTNMGLAPAGSAAARLSQLKNAMLWRPDLAGQFAAALQWIGLPSLGLTPTQTPTSSFPNVSGDTPREVYAIAATAPATAFWNAATSDADYSISPDKMTATRTGSNPTNAFARCNVGKTSGSVTFHINATGTDTVLTAVGLDDGNETGQIGSGSNHSVGYYKNGEIKASGFVNGTVAPWGAGDDIRIDSTNNALSFYKNDVHQMDWDLGSYFAGQNVFPTAYSGNAVSGLSVLLVPTNWGREWRR